MPRFLLIALVLLNAGLLVAVIMLITDDNDASGSDGEVIERLNHRINELEANRFTPGLGELMLGVEAQYIKLDHARKTENWELADFLVHEIEEVFEKVEDEHPVHDEVNLAKLIPQIIEPPLDRLDQAIDHRNLTEMNEAYKALTAGCNNCHVAANHAFVRIYEGNGTAPE